MTINQQLTCKYCNEIYTEPVTLNCCGDNICKRHINEFLYFGETNKLLCPLCNLENAHQNFNVNKLIQSLIKNELHKLDLDPNYKATLDGLKGEIEKLETILKDPENFIFDEIGELKRKVDLDREKLKSEIDALAEELIQKLESFEKEFKAEYKTNVDLKNYTALVESAKKQSTEFEKCLNLFSAKTIERDEKCKISRNTIKDLQPKLKQFKEELLSSLVLTYRPIGNNIKDFFGKLIIKVGIF